MSKGLNSVKESIDEIKDRITDFCTDLYGNYETMPAVVKLKSKLETMLDEIINEYTRKDFREYTILIRSLEHIERIWEMEEIDMGDDNNLGFINALKLAHDELKNVIECLCVNNSSLLEEYRNRGE